MRAGIFKLLLPTSLMQPYTQWVLQLLGTIAATTLRYALRQEQNRDKERLWKYLNLELAVVIIT